RVLEQRSHNRCGLALQPDLTAHAAPPVREKPGRVGKPREKGGVLVQSFPSFAAALRAMIFRYYALLSTSIPHRDLNRARGVGGPGRATSSLSGRPGQTACAQSSRK